MSRVRTGGAGGRGNGRVLGIAASAVLVVVAVALALVGGSDDGDEVLSQSLPHVVTTAELTELEATLGHPIYWTGPRAGAQLELKEEADGSVYLRYLRADSPVGDPSQEYLTVGTYPVQDAVGALRRGAGESGGRLERSRDGAVVLVDSALSTSAYLAYPGSDLQIEVYDPKPGRALQLIRAGAVRPVGEGG